MGPSFDKHEIDLLFLAQAQCLLYLPRSLRFWIMHWKLVQPMDFSVRSATLDADQCPVRASFYLPKSLAVGIIRVGLFTCVQASAHACFP
jgi:hypothetical protein